MLKKILYLFLLISLPMLGADNVQNFSYGKVNWTQKKIIVTGSGIPSLKANNRAQTEKLAKNDAYRNAIEVIKSLKVKTTTIESLMNKDKKLRVHIESQIKQGKIKGQKYYDDGGVDIILEIPLNSLLVTKDFLNKKNKPLKTGKEKKYSSVIIKLIGFKYKKTFFPTIKDESGKLIYSLESTNLNKVQKDGMVTYVKKMSKAKKIAGDSPLIVTAKMLNKNGDIVISDIDSKKLENIDLSFFSNGNVIFIVK